MQQTKFDRWLREKYTYITRVYSNTKPSRIPPGIEFEKLNVEKGSPYRFRFTSRQSQCIEALAKQMEREKITYTSRVEDIDVWYGKFINNPKKSFTYQILWAVIFCAALLFAFSPLPLAMWEYASKEEEKAPLPVKAKVKKTPPPKEKFAEWQGRFDTSKK